MTTKRSTGRLEGRTALITGGTTGIGFATARRFIAEGARVAITGENADRVARAGEALGPQAIAIRSDSGRISDLEPLALRIGEVFGSLHILFLNAGIAPFADLAAVTEAVFDKTFAVNVKGVLFAVQRFVDMMHPGGSIIVTTSVNNRICQPQTHSYSASKAAAGSLVRTLAGELAERKLRVNGLSPGPVMTEIGGTTGLSDAEGQAFAEKTLARVTMHRFAAADELAGAALFLASDDSSYITGQEIVVDGGWTGVGG